MEAGYPCILLETQSGLAFPASDDYEVPFDLNLASVIATGLRPLSVPPRQHLHSRNPDTSVERYSTKTATGALGKTFNRSTYYLWNRSRPTNSTYTKGVFL